MRRYGYLFLFCLVAFPWISYSKSLYVSTTGDDDTTYENNGVANPWATPSKAWFNADAGDSVFFRGGTYSITSTIVTKYTANNGVDGSPIVFTSYPGEQAVFSTTLTWYVFGIQKNYNHVDNIDFIGDAPTWFYLGEDVAAHHFEIRNCNATLGTGGDNTGFVKTSGLSDYVVIEYCDIEGPGLWGDGIHGNTSCIYPGSTDYSTIRYNTLYNAPIGIYFKTDNDEESNNEIAYNYIYNCDRNSIQTNSQYTTFSNNIIGADCGPFQVNEGNGFALGDNNTINHNTIMSGGLLLNTNDGGADNNTITNNIISSYTACCDGNSWDYNLYISGSAIGASDIANQSPTFTTTPQVDPEDFALTAASYGYQSASDGEDMGVIDAPNVGAGGTAEPATITAPTNLQSSTTHQGAE